MRLTHTTPFCSKRGVILIQEHMQMLMPPPVERKVVIFNMNDFGIRNMDWWCVFFMVKTMESYYVETLAKIYVHGYPWIFRPIWTILKPLLDPVVRDKIRLTTSPEELAEHVPFDHLPKRSMRGGMDWEFEYPRPEENENDTQADTQTRDLYQAEYDQLAREFQAATQEICQLYTRSSMIRRAWDSSDQEVSSESEVDVDMPRPSKANRPGMQHSQGGSFSVNQGGEEIGQDLKAKRDVIATRLRVAFLKLRPYIVGKSLQERWNVLRPDGSIHWEYPKMDGTVEKQVLGQGTTLPELQQNLEMIDQAAAQQSSLSQEGTKASQRHKEPLSEVAGIAGLKLNGSESKLKTDQQEEEEDDKPNPSLAPFLNGQSTRTNSSPSNANSGSTITPSQHTNTADTRIEEQSSSPPKPVPIHPLEEIHRSRS